MLGKVVAVAGARAPACVCRGNWSRDERTLLRGGYSPLAPWFAQMPVTQLVLEYATPRAGDLIAPGGKELGLGVVNQLGRGGGPGAYRGSVEALLVVPAEKLFLNPDCGFGTFAARPINEAGVAEQKLAAMAEAARRLRAG